MDIQFLWIPSPSPNLAVTIHFRLNLYHFLPSHPPVHLLDVINIWFLWVWNTASGLLQIVHCQLTMTSHFADMTSSSIFFDVAFVSLCKFIDWSKFHINIITDSAVMTIFLYKWLTRNLDIGNTSVWVLPNIWRLGQVRDTEFGTNVANVMVLNATKCQAYSFYPFWAIKGEPTSSGKKYFC